MDKNSIKKYAIWARRELISRVAQKALQYGITEKEEPDPKATSINGKLLSKTEIRQRQALILKIKDQGYKETVEEIAYTWFNRFMALRFMEVNGYIPSGVRVFTNDAGEFNPQILSEAIHLDIPGLDMDKVYSLKSADKNDELFKYLLISQCNALNALLPEMFEKIEDYTDLLLPDYLLREGSVAEQMVSQIPEEDWKDQVQIIGWMYQYYTSEKKDAVFEAMKKNIKVSKENIAVATQLFTPDWIVRYMVENSLGRLWLDGHLNAEIRSGWKYYLDEAEQTPEVQAQLAEIRKGRKDLNPEQIHFIDPCMGSGHILVYAFDIFMQIYLSCGYTEKDATQCIVRNNLWGLDLDKRAYQLAYFAVMMKARHYDRRFLTKGIKPNLSYFQDLPVVNYSILDEPIRSFVRQFENADTYGSLVSVHNIKGIEKALENFNGNLEINTDQMVHMKQLYRILSQKYDVVCTNPPYMGASGMDPVLSEFVKKQYPDSKSDLFAVFIERCAEFAKADGYYAMITQHSWMFLPSYEKLRGKLKLKTTINMAHLGARAFDEINGEIVQTTSFVYINTPIKDYRGKYKRLLDGESESEKRLMFLSDNYTFGANSDAFLGIPGNPIAYWISPRLLHSFSSDTLNKYAQCCTGMQTGDNNKYIRIWYEVDFHKTALFDESQKYKRYNCGGEFRKWYGNHFNVVMWENEGSAIRKERSSVIRNEKYFLKQGISWKRIASGGMGFRYLPINFIFDQAGDSLFVKNDDDLTYILGYLNSKVSELCFSFIAPTMNLTAGNMNKLPIIIAKDKIATVSNLVIENIDLCKVDWDSFETSWDFKRHPLISVIAKNRMLFDDISAIYLSECYECWKNECDERFDQLKSNEEELNRIFIDIYGLQDELTPEVEDKDVTVRKADLQRDIRSFISYAVGCMFGRYSLDVEGLAYAGGEWDASKYSLYNPDSDGIIPICDDEYFDDDIVGRFIKFVETVFGKETLEENLSFIADALGGKGSARDVIRKYFLNDFYADHVKIYQKRPIYWLFDSGKHNGFKCLIYMHKYRPDTIARIRTDYVHEQQSRYRTAKEDFVQHIINASASERIKLNKRLNTLNDQIGEIKDYEEKIHHLADQMIAIDLDDGVKHNYELFKDVLAKIK